MRKEFYQIISCLWLISLLASCTPKTWTAQTSKRVNIPVQNISPDSTLVRNFETYKQKLDSSMNEVVGYLETDMPLIKSGEYETLLGNFAADVLLAETIKASSKRPDLSVVTTGGLRVPLYKGEITVGTLFEFQPFDNEMLILEIKGKDLYPLFEYHKSRKNTAIGNTKVVFENDKLTNVLIGGVPLEEEKTYSVAISDYLADGGDEMKFWNKANNRTFVYVKARDMFITYFQAMTNEGKKVNVTLDNRFVVK